MLCGDGWAFIHIPKCGGTSVRSALTGREVSEVLPMGASASASHRFHWIAKDRPCGKVFTTVRRPSRWLASYWKMRLHEGRLDQGKPLDRLWCGDLNEFVLRVAKRLPGYISRVFCAYAECYPNIIVYRLEDGLGHVTCAHKNALSGPRLSERALAVIERSESEAMEKFDYARIAGR